MLQDTEMTGYPVELVPPGNGTSKNKGRGRSLSMSALQSKSLDENDNITPCTAKSLKRSQSLKVLDANQTSWRSRIARARSEDNVHRKSSEGVFEEANDNTANNHQKPTVTSATKANSQIREKPKVETLHKKNLSPKTVANQTNNLPQFRRHSREVISGSANIRENKRLSTRDMSSCEGIEEESNELETESGMEGGQSMPSSSDDVGTIDVLQVPLQSLPQVPLQSLPQVPLQSLPQVPLQSLPQVPLQSLPQVPLQSLPQVPPQSLPQVPPQSLPQVPPQSLPQVPPQSLPQVPPQAAGFAPFMFIPGFNPGTLPQAGYPFPQNSIIIMNNCNNIQFGNQNTINSTQHHEHHPGGKFQGLNPDTMRMLINLTNPEDEQQMLNDLQDEDKRKDFVSGLKAFGTQLKTARGGCVLLDFELSKDPEERLRFLRSCQSGEFQRFIQTSLLSRYVEDPRKVSMVLCFSIASITDTECGEMAFNFNWQRKCKV
ncbi:PREDICTED: uncharacterized protein LOC109486075 [Branchiostoma belcheri]|uniref:Uncharacterized protein LOC109486075 n=1 Tax=Branchiostoma belcheri TaxID=7741 RepID=A0A6P5AQG8_BRABE|nr:PREDICTED: uncharacterized protein LOC109486075 [Branchiostoma belcheri]